MFEKRIKKTSEKLGEESKKEFYILTHKKHGREVYFQNNFHAINFIKVKFDPSSKKFRTIKSLIYLFIRLRILQPFLKKIELSSKFGEVVFVGGQIKGFNLKEKEVISFPLFEQQNKDFIKSKEFQKKVAKEGFAPRVFELNKKFPFSREELLIKYKGNENIKIFRKLMDYYSMKGINETTLQEYIKLLKRKLGRNKHDPFIQKILKSISSNYPRNTKLKMVQIHGDFSKEQILLKKKVPVFIDWDSQKNLIATDLIKFFREEKNFLKNSDFHKILKIYPEYVRNNIKLYFLLDEIYDVAKRDKLLKMSRDKIKNVFEDKK
jgi:hypothetical protein